MKIAEMMKLDVKSCHGRDFLNKAAKMMWDNDCGCLPVIDAEGKVTGIITDRDITMAAYTQGTALHAIRVESAMTRNVIACSPGDDLQTVQELMRQNQVHRVPVIDLDGKLVGIVSINDLALAAQQRRKEEIAGITNGDISQTLGAISQPRGHVFDQIGFAPEAGEMEFVPGPPPKRGPWRR